MAGAVTAENWQAIIDEVKQITLDGVRELDAKQLCRQTATLSRGDLCRSLATLHGTPEYKQALLKLADAHDTRDEDARYDAIIDLALADERWARALRNKLAECDDDDSDDDGPTVLVTRSERRKRSHARRRRERAARRTRHRRRTARR